MLMSFGKIYVKLDIVLLSENNISLDLWDGGSSIFWSNFKKCLTSTNKINIHIFKDGGSRWFLI
jgi:hypothetical protein